MTEVGLSLSGDNLGVVEIITRLATSVVTAVLTFTVHRRFGWRSFHKVASRGYRRSMHRALLATYALTRWCVSAPRDAYTRRLHPARPR